MLTKTILKINCNTFLTIKNELTMNWYYPQGI